MFPVFGGWCFAKILNIIGRSALRVAPHDATEPGGTVQPRRRFAIVFLALAAMLFSTSALAVSPFAGDPPVNRLVPKLDVYPQNFALAQTPDGNLFIGSHDGVIIFNGEHWSLAPLPNGDIVRSLAVDSRGRVYVGGYDQFGYLFRDDTGHPVFHDLAPLFARDLHGETFADIWDTLITPYGIFFRGVQHLFLFDPESETVRMWRHDERFGGIAMLGDDVILQFRGEGLRRFNGSEWIPMEGTQDLLALVPQLVALGEDHLLLLSKDGRWLQLSAAGELSAFPVPEDFPSPLEFTRATQTRNGEIAFATRDGALVVLSKDGGSFRRFFLSSGFISALERANDGGLFMLSNEEVLHVGWPPQWTVTGREHGLAGSVHAFAHWGSRSFVLSSRGVEEAGAGRAADGSGFTRHAWTEHAAWDLLPLSASRALLADSYALRLVTGNDSRALTHANFYPRLLQRSAFNDDVVWVGTELGFAVLRARTEEMPVMLDVNDIDAPRVNSIVEVSPVELWLGTERAGVLHVLLDESLTEVRMLEYAGESEGLAYGKIRSAQVSRDSDGSVLASTERGIFRLSEGRFTPASLDGLDALRGANERLVLAVSPKGDRWAYSFNHVFRQVAGGAWQELDVGAQLRGSLETMAFASDGSVLFGASSSVLRFQPGLAAGDGYHPEVGLTRIEYFNDDGETTPLPLQTATPIEFPAGEVNIRFRFAVADFKRAGAVRYSAILEGLESQWSAWSSLSGFTYYRMRPGDYALRLRAIDANGHSSESKAWRFRVVPPWYRSTVAMIAGGALLILFLFLVFQSLSRRRTGRLAAETRRLEAMVAERTFELEDANRKLEAIAHLDGLTGIPNRRRLDEYLAHVWQQCAERERPLTVLVIDVDHFKKYNDQYGHIAGDRLLKKLARVLTRSLRRSEDLVARYGGEEFLVVLPGADLETAAELAESVRSTVETSSLGATVSIGLASTLPVADGSILDLVERADAGLYEAKAAGRNRVRRALVES